MFWSFSRWACTGAAVAMTGVAVQARAAAPDAPFTVANFPVDATAKDAVAAKDKAHAEGQAAAFRSLLKRLVPVTAYDRLARLRQEDSAAYLQGTSVRSERNSSTTYIASLDFTFSGQGVRDFLRREGIPFVDQQAKPSVLVAAVRNGEASSSSRAQPLWMDAWRGLDTEHALSPIKVEALKPAIHAESLKKLAEGGDERILAGEYGSDAVVAAIAEVDRPANRLHVVLSGRDSVGPIYLKRSYNLGGGGGDLAYTLELAAVVSLGILEGRWKAVTAQSRGGVDVMSGPGTEVRLLIEFSSLSQWNDIRQLLLETTGVDDVRVDSVSARSADVSLVFPGGGPQLANALAPKGLVLRSDEDGWLLRSQF